MDSIVDAQRHLIVLKPSSAAIAERELGRGKGNSYRDWQKPGMTLVEAIESMQESLKGTPRRGLWLDSSGQNPEQTVDAILANEMKESRY
jgi:hypothetical protein